MARINSSRSDPYKNFKFRVKWEGRYVAGFSKVGALAFSTEVASYCEGGDPSTGRKLPGGKKYEAITFEQGMTHDTEFEEWANKVWSFGGEHSGESSLGDFRRDLIVDVINVTGQRVISHRVFRAWVSEFTTNPDPHASGDGVAIQSMKLENEGFECDQP